MNQSVKKDHLLVKIFSTREDLGFSAASETGNKIKELLKIHPVINIIFAAAPSQNEFLKNLIEQKDIEWEKINAFHMDEYIGLPSSAPQLFGNYLNEHIFYHKPFRSINYLNGQCDVMEIECQRYSKLLEMNPPHIVCMGIGENGHLAFNDPPVADFQDKKLVKVVELDAICRQQQVNDKCFSRIEQVPTHAITLTIPALLKANFIFCMVPGKNKAQAVYNTLEMKISGRYPSTILRNHEEAILYIDILSSSLLNV